MGVSQIVAAEEAAITARARLQFNRFSSMFYGGGFTRWHCAAGDRIADALTPGYFDEGAKMIAAGDMIDVSAMDGGMTLYVTASANDRVRVEIMSGTMRAWEAGFAANEASAEGVMFSHLPSTDPMRAARSRAFTEEMAAGFEFRRNPTPETERRYIAALARMGELDAARLREMTGRGRAA